MNNSIMCKDNITWERSMIYLNRVLYKIKKIREEKDFSKAFLAKAPGLNEKNYAQLESGEKRLTPFSYLRVARR